MSTVAETSIAENAHITSLNGQLTEGRQDATQLNLAVISANPTLDFTAVAQLKQANVLLLRPSTEALSKALEDVQFAEAVCWAVEEGGVNSLTLVGHSQAASMPLGAIASPNNPSDLLRIHNERIEASRLKLKDDLARFLSNPVVQRLVDAGRLSVHALFFLQESATFLRFLPEDDELQPRS